ncbi:MAG: hypothetical protein SV253_03325 [Halobacteria archaeon]|nr:hypothetical protein [Halobacteria archaeon]
MAAKAHEKREAHIRGVKVTALSSVFGILAAAVSWFVTTSMGLGDIWGLYLLVGAVGAQKPLLPYLGKEEMDTKDWLYVGFMTFDLWFISWTLLLTG